MQIVYLRTGIFTQPPNKCCLSLPLAILTRITHRGWLNYIFQSKFLATRPANRLPKDTRRNFCLLLTFLNHLKSSWEFQALALLGCECLSSWDVNVCPAQRMCCHFCHLLWPDGLVISEKVTQHLCNTSETAVFLQ